MSPLHVTMSAACTAYCFQECSPDALYQPKELTYAHLIEVGSVSCLRAQDYTYFLKQPTFKESILSLLILCKPDFQFPPPLSSATWARPPAEEDPLGLQHWYCAQIPRRQKGKHAVITVSPWMFMHFRAKYHTRNKKWHVLKGKFSWKRKSITLMQMESRVK